MKKQNLKLAILVALVGVCGNAFAYRGGIGTPYIVSPQSNTTVTFGTNGNVPVNDLNHTVTNGETFNVAAGTQVELIPEYYSINGGIGLGINVLTGGVTNASNGNSVSTGMYYFPDVDVDGHTVETSPVDSLGTAATMADGNDEGHEVTSINSPGTWTAYSQTTSPTAVGVTDSPTKTYYSPGLYMSYSAPSKGVVQGDVSISSYTTSSTSSPVVWTSASMSNGDGIN